MTKNNIRLVELDCLRGLAAFAVVISHLTDSYTKLYPNSEFNIFKFTFSGTGVMLFFMISGFVIFLTLSKTENPLDFIISRFSRLYPAYWASIALTSIFLYILPLPNYDLNIKLIVANLTMIQQVMGVRHIDWSYWTLQVELFFYAAMFAIFLFGMLKNIETILTIWTSISIIYVIAENQFGHNLSWTIGQLLIIDNIPFFSLGIVFYQIYKKPTESAPPLICCFIFSITAAILRNPEHIISIGLITLIFYLFVKNKLGFIASKPLVFLGSISYPLYLVHQYIGFCIMNRLGDLGTPPLIQFLIALSFSLIAAYAISRSIEKPAMLFIRSKYKKWRQKSHK